MADKRESDPLEGAQFGPKEPRSRMQRLMDTITDADYSGALQSLGPNGYVMGGLAGIGDAVGLGSKAAKATKDVADKASKYAKGGQVKSASRRGDGIAQRGKTRGRLV